MKILITGGAGFIGSHLCNFLIGKGHKVICMDNLITGNLNNIKKLESCSLGYRADYIRRAAGKIASKKDFLKRIKNLSYEDAKKELIKLPGVGDKVADCILLFSLGHHEAFPVDVWIKRIMEQNYFGGKAMPNKKIVAFARDYFGEYAGYAQQFLYHYARNLNEK